MKDMTKEIKMTIAIYYIYIYIYVYIVYIYVYIYVYIVYIYMYIYMYILYCIVLYVYWSKILFFSPLRFLILNKNIFMGCKNFIFRLFIKDKRNSLELSEMFAYYQLYVYMFVMLDHC